MENQEKRALALEHFDAGYNCAQSVLLAFCEEAGLDALQAKRLSSSFGGGMGRLGEVCGAVSAAFMVIGAVAGYDVPGDTTGRGELYAKIRAFAAEFAKANGDSILCRDLQRNGKANAANTEDEQLRALYSARPCRKYVDDAARLLSAFLAENGREV